MRSAWVACVTVLVGCYQPEPPAGARCAEGGLCPRGLACRDGICVDENAPIIDAPAPVDARPLDAITMPPDAANVIGCADGAREAFTDLQRFPNVAGCAASWSGALGMRAPATGQACGDDLQLCAAPADACAAGWHVCGTNGLPTGLTSRMTEADCTSAGNAGAMASFVGAFAHCVAYDASGCDYAVPRGCPVDNSCGEPVCCGAGCRYDVGCPAGAFGMQGAAGTTTNGCGAMLATDVTGVLCCR